MKNTVLKVINIKCDEISIIDLSFHDLERLPDW